MNISWRALPFAGGSRSSFEPEICRSQGQAAPGDQHTAALWQAVTPVLRPL